MEAGEADAAEPRRRLVEWKGWDGRFSTFRIGFGFLGDAAAYSQDSDSEQQVTMKDDVGVRDFRILLRGRFKTKRPLSWNLGYMYDGVDDEWRFRLTGLMIGFPEVHGQMFIGRTKEGYSMNKVMNGYTGWTIERSEVLDAFVPILADGVKWMGYYPGPRVFFSVGAFMDGLSEDEKFATYDYQFAGRVGWLPILSAKEGKLLHLAVMDREGKPDEGSLQVRSRPEAYLSPYFLDTGKIPADHGRTTGAEAYYQAGRWLFGAEYNWQSIDATSGENPLFHGGNVFAAWFLNDGARPYNTAGAFFEGVSPTRSVFEKGPGVWELVLNVSYSDFDSGGFTGGKFWRVTPTLNWYLADGLRLGFVYGYGVLDRFGVDGRTQFFQFRLQTYI